MLQYVEFGQDKQLLEQAKLYVNYIFTLTIIVYCKEIAVIACSTKSRILTG